MIDLHLHVGMHKTGTTYLQSCLMQNRDALAERGVHLMDKPTPYPADHALWSLLHDEGPARFAEAIRTTAEDRGARQMVLSSEQFCLHLRDPVAARALAEALAPAFRTRIYIWLRRQDTMRESVYSQLVKRTHVGSIRESVWYSYDYETWLRTIEDAFDADALVVRLYHDRRRDDVFLDFLALAGIELPDPVRVREANVSPSRRETLFMSMIPKDSVPRAETILRVMQTERCIADDGIKTLLSPAERRSFLADHIAGNARLADRHRLSAEDRAWLTILPPEEPDWRPPAPISRAERLHVWRACMGRVLSARSRSLGLAPAFALSRTLSRAALAERRR